MRPRLQDVLRDALTLPPQERANLAAELLGSLEARADDHAEVEAAWAAEIETRARRVLRSESAAEPWEEVRSRIETDLNKR
jgi:putative addiction module component (TIGR02574 family)